eukprot:1138421-Pelagomonas_calceolata.AAC.6
MVRVVHVASNHKHDMIEPRSSAGLLPTSSHAPRGSQVVQGPADRLGGIGAALMEAGSLGAGGGLAEHAQGHIVKHRKKPRTHMQAAAGSCGDPFWGEQAGGGEGEEGCGGGGWRGRKRGAGKGGEGGMEKGGKRRPHADVDVWPEKDSTTK